MDSRFGEYLRRIEKEATIRCHHCDERVDSAQYTLEHCPSRENLPTPAVLRDLLTSEGGRRAVAFFCEQIMLQKEAAKRERQQSYHPERINNRRRVIVEVSAGMNPALSRALYPESAGYL
ncbi:uncharacterized protein LOC132912741 [Bombus pascuorum]|uniref:uncharacterized protein LOC132912741 n=1 Tax=Bombus pascuorum TaxID=65598 RepID=UPI00298E7F09|nr:uncharacterized protein LOC132912741 [Bombus pascuorum]